MISSNSNRLEENYLQATCQKKDWYAKYTKSSYNNKKSLKCRQMTRKRNYKYHISIWNDAQHRFALGKCKLKQEWDTDTHLLELLKSKKKTLTLSIVGKDWNNMIYYYYYYSLLVGIQNHTVRQIIQLLLAKINIIPPYDPAIALLKFYSIDLKTYVHIKNWRVFML